MRSNNNIVILEKSDTVRGNCYDVHHQGGVNALGAFLVTEEYFDSFSPLSLFCATINSSRTKITYHVKLI